MLHPYLILPNLKCILIGTSIENMFYCLLDWDFTASLFNTPKFQWCEVQPYLWFYHVCSISYFFFAREKKLASFKPNQCSSAKNNKKRGPVLPSIGWVCIKRYWLPLDFMSKLYFVSFFFTFWKLKPCVGKAKMYLVGLMCLVLEL